jgi:hypothetical protein
MNPALVRFLCVLFSAGLATEAIARISTESPFMPKNGQVMAAPTENTPIELRGVMASSEGILFGIYEPASQKGSWIKAGEAGHGYVVRSYDEGRASVSVEYQGRLQTLTLKEAKFDGAIAAVPMSSGSSQIRPAVMPGAPAVANNPAEEAKRLEQVANEVRRRRAARQAATQQSPAQAVPAPATTTQ